MKILKQPSLIVSFSIIFMCSHLEALADDTEHSDSAVQQTQEMLKSPQKRQELLKDSRSKKANQDASNLVGSENLDEMYSVVSEILPLIVKEAAGDSAKMTQLLAEYQKNPQAFYKKLPPETQARIKALADKADKKTKRTHSSP